MVRSTNRCMPRVATINQTLQAYLQNFTKTLQNNPA